MEGFERYAIYYAPAVGSALMHYGNGWLGFDPETGFKVNIPVKKEIVECRIDKYISSPRRYGFHGTLKPPFSLSKRHDIYELDLALQSLAGRLKPAISGPLVLKKIGRFICLAPTGDCHEIEHIAASTVKELDRFRGPQSEALLAKRRAAGLSAKQEAYLQRYGYPYVLDEFRFHLTLTNSLADEDLNMIFPLLEGLMEEVCREDFWIRELCLFADPGDNKPFQLLKRYPLSGEG